MLDPSIYERSFARTMGLARFLVLEALPKPSEREEYLAQQRAERGRPEINTWHRDRHKLTDNVKDREPDDVAEWNHDDDIANYHTFTVPYGPKYNAKKIEKLLYTKDLLLNVEWNVKKDRTVNLHQHPCFFLLEATELPFTLSHAGMSWTLKCLNLRKQLASAKKNQSLPIPASSFYIQE